MGAPIKIFSSISRESVVVSVIVVGSGSVTLWLRYLNGTYLTNTSRITNAGSINQAPAPTS